MDRAVVKPEATLRSLATDHTNTIVQNHAPGELIMTLLLNECRKVIQQERASFWRAPAGYLM